MKRIQVPSGFWAISEPILSRFRAGIDALILEKFYHDFFLLNQKFFNDVQILGLANTRQQQ